MKKNRHGRVGIHKPTKDVAVDKLRTDLRAANSVAVQATGALMQIVEVTGNTKSGPARQAFLIASEHLNG